jgi:4-hydroxybenzoyl-CoA thioesterase
LSSGPSTSGESPTTATVPAPVTKFVRPKRIRFAHCDPAGIVFYPQYFMLFNELVEDWFTDVLKAPWSDLHFKRHMGSPMVHLECDFVSPCRLGEILILELDLTRVGRSSIELAVSGTVAGQVKVTALLKLVITSFTTGKAVPIPADLREKLGQAN